MKKIKHITWNKYDGKDENLPNEEWCLVQTIDKKCFIPRKAIFKYSDKIGKYGMHWKFSEYVQTVSEGDIWCYLPKVPEDM